MMQHYFNKKKIQSLKNMRIETIKLPVFASRNFDLKQVLHKIKSLGFKRVLVEAGFNLTADFLNNNLVDDFNLFVSNKKLGTRGMNNIKNTLFFSYSVIFSTLFFLTYLWLKNTCWGIENDIQKLSYSKLQHTNKVKSLNRKRNLSIRSIEGVASKNYGFHTPDPEPLVVIMKRRD